MSNTDVASLFRREVINARAGAALGSIRLSQPVSTRLIAFFSLSIALAIGVFLNFATYTKRAHVVGITVPVSGQISLASPYAGTIRKIYVDEGAEVKKGQSLIEIASDRQTQLGGTADLLAQQLLAKKDALQRELELTDRLNGQTISSIESQLKSYTQQKTKIDSEIQIVKRRLAIASEVIVDYERLHNEGFMSIAHVQQKQNESLDIESRISTLERTKIELGTNIEALIGQRNIAATELASKKVQLDKAMTSLQQELIENTSRAAAIITAAHDGVMLAINTQLGQAVVPGQTIAMLLPARSATQCIANVAPRQKRGCDDRGGSDLNAQFFATSRTSGFVMPGQTVLIRMDAFPYQKFGLQQGVVADVSRTPFAPNELPANIAPGVIGRIRSSGGIDGEGLYRITVKLKKQTVSVYGKETQLKPGMMLEADVSLDKRAVWEWVLEPLFAIRSL